MFYFLGRSHPVVLKVHNCKYKLIGVQANTAYNIIIFIYQIGYRFRSRWPASGQYFKFFCILAWWWSVCPKPVANLVNKYYNIISCVCLKTYKFLFIFLHVLRSSFLKQVTYKTWWNVIHKKHREMLVWSLLNFTRQQTS